MFPCQIYLCVLELGFKHRVPQTHLELHARRWLHGEGSTFSPLSSIPSPGSKYPLFAAFLLSPIQ